MPLVDRENQTSSRPAISESERSAALKRYDILDTPRESDFDELAELASQICGTPVALVSLVDTDRQFLQGPVSASAMPAARPRSRSPSVPMPCGSTT